LLPKEKLVLLNQKEKKKEKGLEILSSFFELDEEARKNLD